MRLGYALSSEEHEPLKLIAHAALAEEAGFEFALISDHFHPWIDQQGQSPFVWSVLGGLATATTTMRFGTGVTCPTIRTHPAIIAQAAATTAAMMPGRFFLGVGTGENLNEHITGETWPNLDDRKEMLIEAIDIMRELWKGEDVDHRGPFYTVRDARIYTLPPEPPEIYIAAGGEHSARLAAEHGDGLISTAPDRSIVESYKNAEGTAGPRYGQLTVCWAKTVEEARATAFAWWPNSALKGELTVELPMPRHFEQAAKNVTEDDVAEAMVCGPDPAEHLARIKEYVDAGFDHIYLHQVGPDQRGFIEFCEREIFAEAQKLAA